MIKIEKENIEGITVYSRGKNRDEDGNPYYAYKCIVEFKWDRDHCTSKLVIDCSADYGSSGTSRELENLNSWAHYERGVPGRV